MLAVQMEVLAAVIFTLTGLLSLLVTFRQAHKETRSCRSGGCGGRPLPAWIDERLPSTWHDEMANALSSPCRLPVVISGVLQVVFNLVASLAVILVFRLLLTDDQWWQLAIAAWLLGVLLRTTAALCYFDCHNLWAATIANALAWFATLGTLVATGMLNRWVPLGLNALHLVWVTYDLFLVDGWMATKECWRRRRLAQAAAALAPSLATTIDMEVPAVRYAFTEV
jgi:hypothetical protein